MFLSQLSGTSEESLQKKRGRKPKNTNYFDVREETAVRMFLTATTHTERN